jgi:MFS family permease
VEYDPQATVTPQDAAARDRSVNEPVAYDGGATAPVYATNAPRRETLSRSEVLSLERQRFGGIKFGSAFFGWMAAVGTLVLLTAVIGAVGVALGVSTGTTVNDATSAAAKNPQTTGIVGTIVVAIVIFVAYLAGGYVAGRMARFSGALQGLGVWLWSIIFAIVIAALTFFAGSQWDILGNLGGFPRIPVSGNDLTTTSIITAVVAAIITLGGAILGGIAGMRYHRRVDRAGYEEVPAG